MLTGKNGKPFPSRETWRRFFRVVDHHHKHIRNMLILFFTFIFLWLINSSTYVWQITSLVSVIRPVSRRSCHIGDKIPEMNKKYSIGLLILFMDDNNNQWENVLMERIIQNRNNYAKRYGYTVILANKLIDSSKPPAWSKLIAAVKYLDEFEYIFYTDMDAIIMNPTIRLETLIAADPNKDMIMTNDWSGPNTGIWIAKNTSFTKWFLTEIWNQNQFLTEKTKTGIPYPFEYEQRAFHYVLNTKIWRRRKLPKYVGNSSEINSHILYLPQCAMNSYSLHPLDWRGNFDNTQVSFFFLSYFSR